MTFPSDRQRGLGFQTVDTEWCLWSLFTCMSVHEYSVSHWGHAGPSNIEKANQNPFLSEGCMGNFDILLYHL